jgi:O-glycosyl hydrolase
LKWINTFSKKIRNNYAAQYATHVNDFEELFKKNGAGHLSCSVEESYVKKLLSYFKARG